MPGGDRRGPAGMGPMTGRVFGYCAGSRAPGFANAGYGANRGYGRGAGYGRGGHGRRNQYYATGLTGWQRGGHPFNAGAAYGYAPDYPQSASGYSRESELSVLRGQAEHMEDSLAGINQRIKDLEQKTSN
jgi:hypothetical protein